jgi:hypothetical protein
MASLTRQPAIDASFADVLFGANGQPARAILRGSFSDWRQQAWTAAAAGGLLAPYPLRSGRADGLPVTTRNRQAAYSRTRGSCARGLVSAAGTLEFPPCRTTCVLIVGHEHPSRRRKAAESRVAPAVPRPSAMSQGVMCGLRFSAASCLTTSRNAAGCRRRSPVR